MIKLNVVGMKCGHCVQRVTELIQHVEPGVRVQVDLANKTIVIDSTRAPGNEFSNALAEAGYRVSGLAQPEPPKRNCRCC